MHIREAGARVNHARYRADAGDGFYESYFQRANHPTRPLAFWIRYTLFSPRGRPHEAIGELWAISFDGETHAHVVVKREVPLTRCTFDPSAFAVRIDDATLEHGRLSGAAATDSHRIAWDLSYRGEAAPLFLLPARSYESGLPRAKSLVAVPWAAYTGALTVDGRTIDVSDWIGSQNHNWGTRHTDWYAWAQVAGFDDAPNSFLEVATARLKIGPIWTPSVTVLVLRHNGQELRINSILQGLRAHAAVGYFTWTFRSASKEAVVEGRLQAPANAFVALRYLNPPGGTKYCLNSKIATCNITVTFRDQPPITLSTASRAAFEILTDDTRHGLTARV